MKPKIGVLARPMISESGRKIYGTYQEIHEMIIKFGGIPVQLFPPNLDSYHSVKYENINELSADEKDILHQMVDECDGILLQGGMEFYPYDVEVARYTHEKNIPTLGICLGMQTMGVAMGGILGHVENKERHQNHQPYSHDIFVDKRSQLFHLLKNEKIHVNSRHQDCLIQTDLMVSALSDDGIIEAIEDKNKDFYIGVQWHPESMLSYDDSMNSLFLKFMEWVVKRYEKQEK